MSISDLTSLSQQWQQYFVKNAQSPRNIPWEIGSELSENERSTIAASIQKFQLGKGSDGHHLIAAAQLYAEKQHDLLYAEVIRLFIAEEQRHSYELGRFMDLNQISRIDSTYSDWVFRRIRRIGSSLQICITTLLVAETLALVYYVALGKATSSRVLKALCAQILIDEEAHVQFQTQRLAILRGLQLPLIARCSSIYHACLYYAAVAVVYVDHRKVFRAAGFSLSTYVDMCRARYREVVQAIESSARDQVSLATESAPVRNTA